MARRGVDFEQGVFLEAAGDGEDEQEALRLGGGNRAVPNLQNTFCLEQICTQTNKHTDVDLDGFSLFRPSPPPPTAASPAPVLPPFSSAHPPPCTPLRCRACYYFATDLNGFSVVIFTANCAYSVVQVPLTRKSWGMPLIQKWLIQVGIRSLLLRCMSLLPAN